MARLKDQEVRMYDYILPPLPLIPSLLPPALPPPLLIALLPAVYPPPLLRNDPIGDYDL